MVDENDNSGSFGLPHDEQGVDAERVAQRRDRLFAALTLIAGLGLAVAMPFALKEGAEFFLPTTAALVIAIALVPILEWLERHHIPSPIAAFACVLFFVAAAVLAVVAIVIPATEFFRKLPERIDRIQMNLAPLIELYASLEKSVNRTVRHLAAPGPIKPSPTAAVSPPGSILELAATTAPGIFIQIFFGILVVYFFLSHWTKLRRQTINNRASFGGAMATARVIQDVVDDTAAYLGTITLINAALGAIIAVALWLIGMPYPVMWGGIAALLNYVPYFGPIAAAVLLAVGGLMTFSDIWIALLPAAIMIGCHLLEANAITPLIVGHRLTINPVLILISISFWSWVWGTPGAVLAVPLLIILQTIIGAAGKPDIAGFLFEHGTLTQQRRARFGRRSDTDDGSG
ncbi:AI-2E family transporter [Sphingomonas sp. AR_OL41]|uniref:AI-2E family transporter n=1 Tax=Sphingomonas sp. AR_OL41 TaxID=3042729 RepID=UPI002480E479|nr:AI-2E family transporter [Sphingomonas sp. AR_OL41]MDH7970613.1 AI-2E family transporter [Sphingomonas sp. AR_OL41]